MKFDKVKNSPPPRFYIIFLMVFFFLSMVSIKVEAHRCKPWNNATQSYTCNYSDWTGFQIDCFAYIPPDTYTTVECDYDKRKYVCTGVKCDPTDNSMLISSNCTFGENPPGMGARKMPVPCGEGLVTYVWDEVRNLRGEPGCEVQYCFENCLPGETPTQGFHQGGCPTPGL